MNEENLRKYIGSRIRELRQKKKMTQIELGKKLGVAYNTISAYENGRISPDSDKLFLMADILDCKVDDFFPPMSDYFLDRIKDKRNENLSATDMRFFQMLVEKALSMDDKERAKFMESIKFTVEFYDRMND